MKKGILFLLLFITFGGLQAQDGFEAKPMLVDTFFDAMTADPVGKGKICNTGTDSICLLWRIEEDMVPLGWSAYLCDNNLCYGPGTVLCPEDNPVCLAPGECGVMDLHLLPGAAPVCGKYRIIVWEKDNPSNELTINYQFNCATSTDDPNGYAGLNVYPNPTTDFFQVREGFDIEKLSIHNLLGKQVRDYDAQDGRLYDVTNLTNGMYVVNLFDNRNQVVKSIRLRKK